MQEKLNYSAQLANIVGDMITARIQEMQRLQEDLNSGADPKRWMQELEQQIVRNEYTAKCVKDFLHPI